MQNFDGINHYANNTSFNPNDFQPVKKKKRRWIKWFGVFLLLLVGAGFFFGSTILSKANKIFANKQNIFVRAGRLFISDDVPLKGEDRGTVNVLLLGMGGPGHDGPYLTDTMIVASIDVKTSEVKLVSIPRDFMVRISGRGYNKINAVYAYANQAKEGSGGEAAIAAAEEITGLEIPYYASIDFKGFVSAIDRVGGLDIEVERTFTDAQYPNYNNGYIPAITFQKGVHHMNGETALIYARSRHGNNGEGSDFARSERQKKVMLALKDKLLALNLNNVSTLNKLLGDFTENFRTNFEPHEIKRLNDLGVKINPDNVYSLSLEPQGGIICDSSVDLATGKPAPAPVPTPDPTPTPTPTPTPSGTKTPTPTPSPTPSQTPTPAPVSPSSNIVRAYVVTTCSGKTLTDVHNLLRDSMQQASLQKEAAKVIILNSTGRAIALNKVKALSTSNIIDAEVGSYTGKTVFERTIVYDNTSGQKPNTLNHILSTYGFQKADVAYTQSTADIVVILGNDAITP